MEIPEGRDTYDLLWGRHSARSSSAIAAVQCAISAAVIGPVGLSRASIPPTFNIYEVLCSGEQRALTDLVRKGWMVHFMLQPVQQVLHNPDWDAGLLGRVDKAKEDEIMQEHPPVRSETLE